MKNYGINLHENLIQHAVAKLVPPSTFTKTALKRAIAEFEAWQRKANGAR
jgi:hypothetical protein